MSLSLPQPQRRSAAVSRLSHRSAKASPSLRPSSLLPPLASQRHSTPSTPQLRIVLRKNPPNSPNSLRASAPFRSCRFRVGAYPSGGAVRGEGGTGHLDFDSFLSVAELLCLVSAAVVSVVFAARRAVFGAAGDRVLGWLVVALVGGVASGAWVRRRQWRRVFEQPGTVGGGANVNLVERVEKLEEDLRSSATMIRVLSRQLEKLGIRFRVTRKALKEPIAEMIVKMKNKITQKKITGPKRRRHYSGKRPTNQYSLLQHLSVHHCNTSLFITGALSLFVTVAPAEIERQPEAAACLTH